MCDKVKFLLNLGQIKIIVKNLRKIVNGSKSMSIDFYQILHINCVYQE